MPKFGMHRFSEYGNVAFRTMGMPHSCLSIVYYTFFKKYFYQFFVLYNISNYNLIVDDNYPYYQSWLSHLYWYHDSQWFFWMRKLREESFLAQKTGPDFPRSTAAKAFAVRCSVAPLNLFLRAWAPSNQPGRWGRSMSCRFRQMVWSNISG